MPYNRVWECTRGQEHVPRRLRLPPKDAVAAVMGSSTGQSASAVARPCGGRHRNCHGARFGARGAAVATVGCAEEQRRAASKPQEPLEAQGSEESGAFSHRDRCSWQPLGLLTTVKPPALRGRYDWVTDDSFGLI
jgi:putative transposase